MHDMFTMREKPRDKIGWPIVNFFDIGDFILVSIGVIIKMKQSIVQEAFRHPYLHAMTCDTCYGVRFQRRRVTTEEA